jgi:phytoene dehydrogenase-like protein
MLSLVKWSRISLDDYSSRFTNEFLRKAFPHINYNFKASELPMLINLIFLAGFKAGDMGWPKFGSLEFSKKIEKRFLELGGEIRYRSEVKKIIVQDNQAMGVILTDGSEHLGDVVVSAADGPQYHLRNVRWCLYQQAHRFLLSILP